MTASVSQCAGLRGAEQAASSPDRGEARAGSAGHGRVSSPGSRVWDRTATR